MRRRKADEGDSLDLLLDAISNTFGGVLFLAVLVVILLQFTGAPQAIAPSDEIEDAQQDLDQLRKTLQTQDQTIEALLNGQSSELVKEVIETKKEILRFQSEEELTKAEDRRARNLQDAVKLVEARKEKTQLERKIEEANTVQSRSAKLPKLRKTKKSEFPIVVSADRLCLLYDARGSVRGKARLDDYDIVNDHVPTASGMVTIPLESGKAVVMKPKPGTGVDLLNEEGIQNALKQEFSGLNPKKTYLAIAVFEDSFDSFGGLRNAIVEMGFEYRLIPMELGKVVGSASGGEALVQ